MPQARTNQLAEEETPPPAGHNRPPSPVDLLKADLAETYGAQIAEAGPIAERANAAPEIASDDDLAIWAKIGVDASKLHKALDTARLNEKRPVIAAVDGFFDAAIERVNRISVGAIQRATAWNKKKADAARAVQAAEAERLRKEAEAKRIAAEFEVDESAAAVTAGEAAAIETQIAAAPQRSAADLTRTRTDDGILSTTRTDWKFEIVDVSKIDLNAIRMFIDPKAIAVAVGKIVKTQKGATKIEGVRVFEEETAQFRS
jgi:hypothetical protein